MVKCEKPVVSVCVLTYNHSKYIWECLKGISSQKTDFEIEVIIGEDGSDDGTRELCEDFIKYAKNTNFRIISGKREDVIYIHGHPTGRANLVRCINAARGKYIAICEGDDYWTDKYKLSKQILYLESHPEAALCFHNALILNEKDGTTRFFHEKEIKEKFYTADLMGKWFVPTASILFRNISAFEYPRWFYDVANGDMALQAHISKYGYFGYINECMSVWRIHESGRSRIYDNYYMLWSRMQINTWINADSDMNLTSELNRNHHRIIIEFLSGLPLKAYLYYCFKSLFQRYFSYMSIFR